MKRHLCLSALCGLFASLAFAGDMELEVDAKTSIFLHEDNTWDYVSHTMPYIEKDMVITISSTQSVLIQKDKLWKFLTKAEEKLWNDQERLSSVSGMGKSDNKDYEAAVKLATDTALKQIAARIRKVSGKTMTDKALMPCLRDDRKAVDTSHNFDTMWHVTVKIDLSKDEVENVLACVFPPKPETPDTTKKAQ